MTEECGIAEVPESTEAVQSSNRNGDDREGFAVLSDIDAEVDFLRHSQQLLTGDVQFKEGDIVFWRPCMKNRKWPAYNQPAIVLDVLAEPIIDTSADVNGPYYGEKLNVRLGLRGDDGAFYSYMFNGGRFEKRDI